MPKYEVSAPNGKKYVVNAPEGATLDDAIAYVADVLIPQEAQATPEKPVGLKEALVGGAKRLGSSALTAIQAPFDDEAAQKGVTRQEGITERPGASFEKTAEKWNKGEYFGAAKEAISQVPAAVAEQLPQLGAAATGARLGAMAGAPFGPAGAVVGGIAGAVLPSFVTQAGTNLERQAQEGKPIDKTAAYTTAVPQAALDFVVDKTVLGKLLGIPSATKLGTQAAEEIAKRGLTRTLAGGTAKGVAAEVPTEVTQQLLERYQAGLPLTTPDAINEYKQAAYGAALAGPLGSLGSVAERSEARDIVAEDKRQRDTALAEVDAERARREAILNKARGVTEDGVPEPTVSRITPIDQEAFDDLNTRLQSREGVAYVLNNLKRYFPNEYADKEARKTLRADLRNLQKTFPTAEQLAQNERDQRQQELEETFAPVFEEEDNPAGYIEDTAPEPRAPVDTSVLDEPSEDRGIGNYLQELGVSKRELKGLSDEQLNRVYAEIESTYDMDEYPADMDAYQRDVAREAIKAIKSESEQTKAPTIEPAPVLSEPESSPVEEAAPVEETPALEEAAPVAEETPAPIQLPPVKPGEAIKETPQEAWEAMDDSGTEFGMLSKDLQQRWKDAVADGYANDDTMQDILLVNRNQKRAEAVSKRIADQRTKTDMLEDDTQDNAMAGTATEPDLELERNVSQMRDTKELADYMARNASTPLLKLVARRIQPLIKGIPLKVVSNGKPVPGGVPLKMKYSIGMVSRNFDDGKANMYLKDSSFRESGMNDETVIHELLHDALQERLKVGNIKAKSDQAIYAPVQRAYDLANQVASQVIADKRAGKPVPAVMQYALEDIDEFFSYGMTNSEVQNYLKGVKVTPTKSLWSEFVQTVRDLLGLKGISDNALSELFSVADDIISAPFQEGQLLKGSVESAQTSNIEADLQAISGPYSRRPTAPVQSTSEVMTNEFKRLQSDPKSTIMGWLDNAYLKAATRYENRAAGLGFTLQDAFNGAFRDAAGTVRGDVVANQNENSVHFAESFLTYGAATVKNGLVKAQPSKYSIDRVFETAKKLADRVGIEESRQLITDTFYLWRAKSLKALDKEDWPRNWKENPATIPTDAQIAAAEQMFAKHPELQEIRTQFIGAKNNAVKFLRETGFLKEAAAQQYLNDDSYAPWFRIMQYEDRAKSLGNVGRVVNLQQMKALKGGNEEVNDMLENMAQFVAWSARSGQANNAANVALNQLVAVGKARKVKGVPQGVDPKAVVMTYEDGNQTFWIPENPMDLVAFMSVPAPQFALSKPIIKMANFLRGSIVLFPLFPAAQLVMDMQRAYAMAGVKNPAAMMKEILGSVIEAYKGTSENVQTLTQYGVSAGVDYDMLDPTRGRGEKFGLSNPETLSGLDNLTKKMRATKEYQALHRLSYSADLAVRLGIYKQTLKETGDEQLAAVRAMEIINFRKTGTSPAFLMAKQMIPFLGVYAQSMGVLYRAMTGRGNSMQDRRTAAKAFWSSMATMAMLSTAYALAMSGDDEYEEQKGFVTDNNFILPGIGKVLPVPREIGLIYKVLPERIIDYVLSQGTDNVESYERLKTGIGEAMTGAFMPPTTLPVITPLVELSMNKSFFTKLPIVGRQYENLSAKNQYNENTTELAKAIGEATGMSPMKIDYFLNAIGGTTAAAMLTGTDLLVNGDRPMPSRIPGLSRFETRDVGGRSVEEYYALRDLYEQANQRMKQMEAEGEGYEEFFDDPANVAKLGAKEAVGSLGKVIEDFRDYKRVIINDETLSASEKREQLDEIDRQINQIMKDSGIRQMRRDAEEGYQQ